MKLIDKDALVAEIENRIKELQNFYKENEEKLGSILKTAILLCIDECKVILSLIDTLEVKEVDIEDSIKETLAQKYIDYTFKRHNIDANSKEGQLIYYAYMHGMNQCLNQLKAQKGE